MVAPKTMVKKIKFKKKKALPNTTTMKKVKKLIKKSISNEAEKKMAFTSTGQALSPFYPGILDSFNVRYLLPSITNGTGPNERIGDLIRPIYMTVKGFIRFNNATAGSQINFTNVMIRLIIASLKTTPSQDLVVGALNLSLQNLLRRGGTNVPFTGYINDLWTPINTELWTPHYDKKIRLTQPNFFTTVGDQDLSGTVKIFSIKVPLPKILRYIDGVNAGVQPTNACPMLMLGYSYMNGATPTQNAQCSISYEVNLAYTDE